MTAIGANSSFAVWSVLCVALASAACEEESDPPFGPGDLDGGLFDATVRLDASGAALSDAEADAFVDSGLGYGECTIELHREFSIEESGIRSWAALQDGDRVHVAYVVRTCGVREASGTAVHYLSLASTGDIAATRALTSDDPAVCATALAPALSVDDRGRLELYFTGDLENGYELYRRSVLEEGTPERLTVDLPEALDNEIETAATTFAGGALVAYSNRLRRTDVGGLVTRVNGGPEIEVLAPAVGEAPIRVVLERIARGDATAILGWVSERRGAKTIKTQLLTRSGTALGAASEIATEVGDSSAVAFASSGEHAAMVYATGNGSSHVLRYRPLDAAGRPAPAVTNLTDPNRSSVNPSIAPYANGYVIAFRELPSAVGTVASLKLLFVTRDGKFEARLERRLGDAQRGGGETRVFVAQDGRFLLFWTDYVAAGATLHAVRARCL